MRAGDESMDIRIAFSTILTCLVMALVFCAVRGYKSRKAIGRAVCQLDLALIPPIIGNLIIIGTSVESLAVAGYYIYFLGMDLVMFGLVRFTARYCAGLGNGQQNTAAVYFVLAADAVQMILNIPFGHAFDVEPVEVQGLDYYRLIPHFGQTIHRVVDYAVFFAVILIFILAVVKSPRIYRERYSIILISMLAIGLRQTFYIFSRTPVDRSMIGFGAFGILITYFSISYRPLRLLDRMLSDIASDMSDGIFVFDPSGSCIWANTRGFEMIGIAGGEPEKAVEGLRIRLSDELGIESLTEGVETRPQFELLSEMGCRLFQGFCFAKPMPVEDFESFVQQQNGEP